MAIHTYKNISPTLGKSCYISESAEIIGDVEIGDFANIWFNSVIRGDMDKIFVGENTNIQDLSMLHVDHNVPLIIGKNVTVGHRVVLHGCKIGDSCLIGMGAVVLDHSIIGKGSVVAAGSIVPPNKEYPENVLILGSPAKVVRVLTEEEMFGYHNQYKHYLSLSREYLEKK